MNRISFVLFLPVAFLAFLTVTDSHRAARADYLSPHMAATSAVKVLEKEIKRDEKILSAPMNIIRLRKSRAMFKADLAEKRELVEGAKESLSSQLPGVFKTLRKTLDDEMKIVNDIRIGEPVRIRTVRSIRNNLKLKKEALRKAEKWLGR